MKELSRIAEEAIAIIRGEAQVACFYYLQKLANVKFQAKPKPKMMIGGGNSTGGTNSLSSSAVKKGATVLNESSRNVDDVHEEELIISTLMQHLQHTMECVGPTQTAALVVSPLCSIVPRILHNCVCHIFSTAGSVPQQSSGGGAALQGRADPAVVENQLLKTKVLRIAVRSL